MVGPFIFLDHMGPAEFRAGAGPRRAAASAYRARHRHLSVRRRDHPSRQPRQRHGDPARRGQLDDGRARHRPFRAHRARSSASPASRCTACSAGSRCRPRSEEREPAFAHHGADDASGRWTAKARPCASSPAAPIGGTSPITTETRHAVRRRRRSRPAPACRSTPTRRSARSISSKARSTLRATASRPAGCWCCVRATVITVTAIAPTRLALVGGAAMDGPRHIWWNFVSSRRERIEEAKAGLEGRPVRAVAGRRASSSRCRSEQACTAAPSGHSGAGLERREAPRGRSPEIQRKTQQMLLDSGSPQLRGATRRPLQRPE